MTSHLIGPLTMWSSITLECSLNFLKYRSWDPKAKAEDEETNSSQKPCLGLDTVFLLLQSIVRAIHKADLGSGARE